MIKCFRNQPPAPNERVAQNLSRIVPDKTISQPRSVAGKHPGDDEQNSEIFLHDENGLDRINRMRV
ncbi:MAG: hypothetical protein DMF47_05545 [Verrucomicrobia bacterium]|nr:MAG: hypothetical protein DMF47_05545 [Verrucomicrobiota bacterium]